MNLKQKLNLLIKANKKRSVIHPNKADLYIGDNEIEMSINGTPSILEIKYKGICSLSNNLPILFKVSFSKNRIIIVNSLKNKLPKLLFNYSGNIKVTSCEILTCDLKRFKAKIHNNQLQAIVDGQSTKFEDDTMTIYDEAPSRRQTKRTFTNYPNIISFLKDSKQKLQKIPVSKRKELLVKAIKTIRKQPIKKVSRPKKKVEGKY